MTVYTAIRVIEGRWKPMIVRRLGDGALGFGQLRLTMPGVTIKVLRQHLRQLEAEGVVTSEKGSGNQLAANPDFGGVEFSRRYSLGTHSERIPGSRDYLSEILEPRPYKAH